MRGRLIVRVHGTAWPFDFTHLQLRLSLLRIVCLTLHVVVIVQHLLCELRIVWI